MQVDTHVPNLVWVLFWFDILRGLKTRLLDKFSTNVHQLGTDG